MASVASSPQLRLLRTLEAVVVIVAALYFGQPVLVPLALAVLLTFLLTPFVKALERKGLPRVAAVGLIAALIVAGSALLAWRTVEQFSDLVLNLPGYRQNLHERIAFFKDSDSRALREIEKTVSDVRDELRATTTKAQDAARTAERAAGEEAPLNVRVVADPDNPFDRLQWGIELLAVPLAQTGLVTVLVIFMLISREDVRNRVVRLAGTGRVMLTTRTLDELTTRISHYLVISALINGGFGLVIGLGLYAIGVHYAMLWGFLAATLRFIPYLGPLVASVLPIGMALMQSAGWTQPLLALALFIVVELLTNNVIEPLYFGKVGGVSTVALLLAAIFWSWVWGPVGLILSVPLTVMLAVLGKYVAPLEPLWVLLGDHPPLAPHVQLYQRLLAGDAEEAADVVEEFARDHAPLEVYDALFVPTLVLAKRDRAHDQVGEALYQSLRASIEQLLDEYLEQTGATGEPSPARRVEMRLPVIGVPAADETDELALEMLRRVVPEHIDLKTVPLATLASEVIELIAQAGPQIVCISALSPGGGAQMRYLCKRIRLRFPEVRILAGRWGYDGDLVKLTANLQARGASQVVTSLAEAVDVLQRTQVLEIPSQLAG